MDYNKSKKDKGLWDQRSYFMKIRVAIILLFLTSCSSFEKKYNDYSHLSEPIEKDYIEMQDDYLIYI